MSDLKIEADQFPECFFRDLSGVHQKNTNAFCPITPFLFKVGKNAGMAYELKRTFLFAQKAAGTALRVLNDDFSLFISEHLPDLANSDTSSASGTLCRLY
jgi:hypothetical protein